MEKKKIEIKIIKAVEEKCNKEIEEIVTCKKVYLLKYCDDKFFYEDVTKFYDIVHQDKYLICHDIIADLFYNKINCDHAYTSSSNLAGHHNMDIDGTLIFIKGIPHYISDDDQLENILEGWN